MRHLFPGHDVEGVVFYAKGIDLVVAVTALVLGGRVLPPETLGPVSGLVFLHLVAFAYHAVLEGQYGITIGKWLAGIRVIDYER